MYLMKEMRTSNFGFDFIYKEKKRIKFKPLIDKNNNFDIKINHASCILIHNN